MEVTEENRELQKQRYVCLYLQFVNKYPYQFVSHKKFLKYIHMFDTKIYVQFMHLSENITPMLLGE